MAYGVDWEALSDSRVMRHHAANNPRAGEPTALEARTHERPRELSIVRCEPPESPLSEERKLELSESLRDFADSTGAPKCACPLTFVVASAIDLYRGFQNLCLCDETFFLKGNASTLTLLELQAPMLLKIG